MNFVVFNAYQMENSGDGEHQFETIGTLCSAHTNGKSTENLIRGDRRDWMRKSSHHVILFIISCVCFVGVCKCVRSKWFSYSSEMFVVVCWKWNPFSRLNRNFGVLLRRIAFNGKLIYFYHQTFESLFDLSCTWNTERIMCPSSRHCRWRFFRFCLDCFGSYTNHK